jgi:hypothetical protein
VSRAIERRLAAAERRLNPPVPRIREFVILGGPPGESSRPDWTRPHGEPFEFTLKIGQVNADGSRTVAEVRVSPPVAVPEAGAGDVLAEYSQGLPVALPRES